MKFYIDPGHGGSSIGAAYKGRTEQDDVLRLSLKIRDYLLKQENVEVMMSRETSINPAISVRCVEANAWKADYYLSVHRNAVAPNKATGAEIWIYTRAVVGGEAYTISNYILDAVCEASGYVNRGVKFGAPSYTDYGVNRLTNMNSALIELGFIDNDIDNQIYDDKLDEMAESIARALIESHGGVYVTKTPEDEDVLYKIRIGAYKNEVGANELLTGAKAKGFNANIVKEDGYFKVEIGTNLTKKEAERLADKAEDSGYGTVFVVIRKEDESILLGDINGDGKISAADARLALRASVGSEKLTEEQTKRADMNSDGKVTASDAREILRQSVGLE